MIHAIYCYCGSGKSFENCCKPLLDGLSGAQSPEELMRSRYSAFVTKNWKYLAQTTLPKQQMEFAQSGSREWMEQAEFSNLQIIFSKENDSKGEVEFKVTFFQNGKSHIHHEHSHFLKIQGNWYYQMS